MTYAAATLLTLAAQCAPNVAPQTVAAIVLAESDGRPLALNVNGAGLPVAATDVASAVATARRYIAAGYSVDLGLGQINSRNMRAIGLTWDTVFDPCTNIAALGRILTGNYDAARADYEPQTALRVALSLYNTGSRSRGFRNGYVAKVVGRAQLSPRIEVASAKGPLGDIASVLTSVAIENAAQTARADVPPSPPAWSLFERAAYLRQVPPLPENPRSKSVWKE